MSSFIHHMLSNHLITALLRAAQTKYLPANPNGFRGIITASRRAIFTVSQVYWIAVCRKISAGWVFLYQVSHWIFLVIFNEWLLFGKRQNCFSMKIIELVPIMITITAARDTFIIKKRKNSMILSLLNRKLIHLVR